MKQDQQKILFLLQPTRASILAVFLVFIIGAVGVRLIDRNDLPLDYAATRQMHSFLIAREFYYRMDTPNTLAMPQDLRQFGIMTGSVEPRIEPPLMEYATALVYAVFDREIMLAPRLLSILFWVIGGIPIFLLGRRLMSLNGAFVALALYLFLPYGVVYSRTFQPDPMAIMFMLWAWYFQIRWSQEKTWKSTVLAGSFTGIAVLVKATSLFFVGFPIAVLVLMNGIKPALKNRQVYLMAALSLAPAVVFNLVSATLGGNAESIFDSRFYPGLFIQPGWYGDWLALAKNAVSYHFLVLSLIGIALAEQKAVRDFLLSLWTAYIAFGFTFAYHIYTHDYYHQPLVPLAALSVGLAVSTAATALKPNSIKLFTRIVLAAAFLAAVAFGIRTSRGMMVGENYQHEAQYWAELGQKIGTQPKVVALTHDYGYRLSYWGGVYARLWPSGGDIAARELTGSNPDDFLAWFNTQTEGYDLFLVTLLGDLERQPDLKAHLFANYSYESGDGWYLFDLRK
ncbi:MAG: glycosyltransferase family 39 protein [Anaerolineae bacterium]|nr:glycosyltransferase family 39 protein [Anaerolineae bacterium]